MKAGLTCFVCASMLLSARAQEWDWVQRFQGGTSGGTSIALDGSENIYVAGGFSGTNQIGTNQLISAGGTDVFITKLNPTGGVVWAISAGGTNDDSIGRIIVATNGAVFVYGHFEIPASLLAASVTNANDTASNVFVARVDDGKFTWINSFPPEVGGYGGALAFAPDESFWLLSASNHIFLKHFQQDGTVLGGLDVCTNVFSILGLAINRYAQFFLHGALYGSVQLASNVTAQGYFVAGLDTNGQVTWAQSGERDADTFFPINQIACAPDGGLISVGYEGAYNFPEDRGVVIKYDSNGTILWKKARATYFKYSFRLLGLTVDARGIVRATGTANQNLIDPQEREKLWLFALDPYGQTLSEQFVGSADHLDQNIGTSIAANQDGDIFVTGQLMGTPLFGTNVMGDGPSGIQNAFVARRATLEPRIDRHRSGTNLVLDWPRTSAPFALQQSDNLATNVWLDVSTPPDVSDDGSQIALSMQAPSRFFRLRRTNELYACQPPRLFDPIQGGYEPFLGRNRVFVSISNSTPALVLSAWAKTASIFIDDGVSFQWFNATTGQPLTNGTSVEWHQFDVYEQRNWIGTLHGGSVALPIGTNTISVIAFDGECRSTNTLTATIEVIAFSTATDQLIAAVQAATTNSANLVAPLQTAKIDVQNGMFSDASTQLSNFQSLVNNSSDLSDADKSQFNSAAQTLNNAIPQ